MLLRRLHRLADGLGHFARLPQPVQVDDFLREFRLASSVLVTHGLLLELQSGAARGFGQRFDPTVIRESAAIENDGLDARLAGALGDRLADGSRAFRTRWRLQTLAERAIGRRGGGQRSSGDVIDYLGIDVVQAAEDGEPRSGGTALQVSPQPNMPAHPRVAAIGLLVHYFAAPVPVLPVLPALRRIRSPR